MSVPKGIQVIVDEIRNRIKDISLGNEKTVSVALSLVALEILNEKYSPELSPHNKKLILGNYPEASLADMEKHGLSEAGLLSAVSIYNQTMQIAIDYSPLTSIKEDMEQDLRSNCNTDSATKISNKAYMDILEAGLTPTGAAATLVANTVFKSLREGVSRYKLMRIINESLGLALDQNITSMTHQEIEEEIIQELCERMGISRETAKKLIKDSMKK